VLLRSAPGLCGEHGFLGGLTTRRGFPPGDDASAEDGRAALRKVLARALFHPADRFAWCRQVHGRRVVHVLRPGLQGDGDALVTADSSLGLLIAVADCLPVLLWDPAGKPFGVAHAGWRGLVAGVLRATVSALVGLGADPAKLRAWIGPAISLESFEVGEEVASRFPASHVHRSHPSSAGRKWTRPHVDLKGTAVERLVAAGLKPSRVSICPDGTDRREELYFSYRRDHGICGRHLAYLVRRP